MYAYEFLTDLLLQLLYLKISFKVQFGNAEMRATLTTKVLEDA